MLREVKLLDGTKFIGKKIFNWNESWWEVTYKIHSSDTFAKGSKVKLRCSSIVYILYVKDK